MCSVIISEKKISKDRCWEAVGNTHKRLLSGQAERALCTALNTWVARLNLQWEIAKKLLGRKMEKTPLPK